MATRSRQEHSLQTEILRQFGNLTWLRLWRNNTGAAQRGNQVVRFGLRGQADISGLMLPHGRRVEIEVKSPTGRQRPEQKKYQEMIERFGGIYILARSIEDVVVGLRRAVE